MWFQKSIAECVLYQIIKIRKKTKIIKSLVGKLSILVQIYICPKLTNQKTTYWLLCNQKHKYNNIS